MSVTNASQSKQRGFAMAPELLLVSSVIFAGVTAGVTNMRDSILAETEDAAEAIGSLNQSYRYDGIRNNHGTARVGGSAFRDTMDRRAGDGVGFLYLEPGQEIPESYQN